jgi:hypothetical protein
MKTDDLVELLARDAGAVTPHQDTRRLALALGAGVPVSALLMLATLGINPVLNHYIELPAFWMKVAFAAVLSGISLIAVRRLSRPGVKPGKTLVALAMPILAMWIAALVVLVPASPAQRAEAFFGQTWAVCPFLVAMLSIPVFIGIVWAMKGLAPTRLRLSGAAAGFLAGALGALVYCVHCPELTAPFIGFWYLLGIAIPTCVGAVAGPRLLRW